MADDEFETSDEEEEMGILTAGTSSAGRSLPPIQLHQPSQATLNATQETNGFQYTQLQQMMAEHRQTDTQPTLLASQISQLTQTQGSGSDAFSPLKHYLQQQSHKMCNTDNVGHTIESMQSNNYQKPPAKKRKPQTNLLQQAGHLERKIIQKKSGSIFWPF